MEIIEKKSSSKNCNLSAILTEGVCRMTLTGDKGGSQSISDDQALELASMGDKLEQYYGSPQDIEWAVTAEGSIYILQCRPLKQLQMAHPASDRTHPESEDVAEPYCQGRCYGFAGRSRWAGLLVRNDVDKLKFPEGAVLVTAQSLPGGRLYWAGPPR